VLRNGTYQIKEGSLLSQQWKVATLEFDVGEDLYFPVVIPCVHCLDFNETKFPTNDRGDRCVCNFAAKRGEGCGEAPKGCPKNTCDPDDVKKYCENPLLEDWNQLHFSTKDDFEEFTTLRSQHLLLDQVTYYRLQVTDPCRGYFVKLNFDYGMADIFFSIDSAEPTQLDLQRYTDFTRYPDHIELLLCPDDSYFHLGTLFFGIVGRSPNVSFDIDVYSSKTLYDTPTPSVDLFTLESDLCKDDDRYICLPEDVAYRVGDPDGTVAEDIYYRYDVEVSSPGECVEITVFLHCLSGDGDLFATWDFPIYLPDADFPTYQSSLQGSDIIYMQKCFDDTKRHSFYIDLNGFDPGVYYITVSRRINSFLRKGLDLSPYQFGYTASRYLFGECPTVNLSCVDWGFSCRNVWSVYPSSEPDPFWPIPPVWVRLSFLLSYFFLSTSFPSTVSSFSLLLLILSSTNSSPSLLLLLSLSLFYFFISLSN